MTLLTPLEQRESSILAKGFLEGLSALTFAVGLVLLIVATQSAQAQTFTVLFNFNGSDGAWPYPTLTLDNAGNLYGTAYQGGYPGSVGVAFEVNPDGTETVLHNFSTGNGDGYWPFAGLTRAPVVWSEMRWEHSMAPQVWVATPTAILQVVAGRCGSSQKAASSLCCIPSLAMTV